MPCPSTWKTPLTSPLESKVNAALAASPSNGIVWRVNSTAWRSLIKRPASRITERVLSPKKSTLSRPIDSRIGNSNCVIAWVTLPLLPLQILWVNLLTDVFPALALALEPTAPGVMQQPPRSPNQALLSRPFLLLISWQGVLLAGIILAAYGWSLQTYGAGAHARTMALFALIGVQIGHMFNCRSRSRSAFAGFFRNPFVWGAIVIVVILQLLALYQPFLARVLDTRRLNATDWSIVTITIVLPVLVVEIAKAIGRWQKRERQRTPRL